MATQRETTHREGDKHGFVACGPQKDDTSAGQRSADCHRNASTIARRRDALVALSGLQTKLHLNDLSKHVFDNSVGGETRNRFVYKFLTCRDAADKSA